MKKIIALILIVATLACLSVAVSSCGRNEVMEKCDYCGEFYPESKLVYNKYFDLYMCENCRNEFASAFR